MVIARWVLVNLFTLLEFDGTNKPVLVDSDVTQFRIPRRNNEDFEFSNFSFLAETLNHATYFFVKHSKDYSQHADRQTLIHSSRTSFDASHLF